MKHKLILIASVVSLHLCVIQNATAQWVQTNGPYGCSVRSLAVSGTNLFAGGTAASLAF